tara:strand:+ start:380 stop:499 length:120 start_codon:yes stop_codon:yes gene_type:complete
VNFLNQNKIRGIKQTDQPSPWTNDNVAIYKEEKPVTKTR